MSHETLKSVADRTLPIHVRADLRWTATTLRGETRWNVQDPVTLRSYQMRAKERFILEQLDGQITLRSLQQRCDATFSPEKVSRQELFFFLQMAQQEALVVSSQRGQGELLYDRQQRFATRQRRNRLLQILAIRLPGFAPQRLIAWLEPRLRWIYSPAWLFLCVLVVAASGVIVTLNWSSLWDQRPGWQQFWTSRTALLIIASIGLSKILHELGHALTAARLGVMCQEIGIMFLVFSPCLYCDVSGASLLTNKWHRIAISLGGIVVELVLAAVCLCFWWLSEPGWLSQFLLTMALVCSVNTLLMNGNPLLKFDGYYVLADWWEIPNLQHAAKSQLRYAVEWWVLRDRPLPSYLAPERSQFALTIYALASVIYRVMLLAIILAFIYGALAARGVAIVGAAIVALVLFTAVGRPASTLVRQLAEPGYRARMHWPKVAGTAIFSLIIVLLVLFVPMRQHVIVPVTFQARGAEPVYVSVAGTLMEASQEGTAIEPDAVLARLEDLELEWQIARLQLQRDEQQLHVEQLERAQSVDDTAAEQLSAARSACDDLNERLSRRQQDQQQLVIRAVRRGVVIPPNISLRPDSSDELPTWDGTPLDPRNRGGLLPSGTLLCWIGDPSQQEVIANLEQSQVDRVRAGQRVRLRCDQLPGKILHGVVQDVSQREIQTEKPAMTSADSLSHAQGGEPYGEATRFEARIVLDAPQHQIRLGARGQAKILVSPESWARRLGAW